MTRAPTRTRSLPTCVWNATRAANRRPSVNAKIGKTEDDELPKTPLTFSNVHYFAAGASLFGNDAQVAYQYAGKDYAGRNMHAPGFQDCTQCHNTHELGLQFDKCVTCHAGVKTAAGHPHDQG